MAHQKDASKASVRVEESSALQLSKRIDAQEGLARRGNIVLTVLCSIFAGKFGFGSEFSNVPCKSESVGTPSQ